MFLQSHLVSNLPKCFFGKITHCIYNKNFFLAGAILLSLYYLFLWNPYKDAPTGTLKQIPTPSAQAKNAPGKPANFSLHIIFPSSCLFTYLNFVYV